jgi:hypothetical protein
MARQRDCRRFGWPSRIVCAIVEKGWLALSCNGNLFVIELDTNVLLENPLSLRSLRNGNENHIILPYTVLEELDKLKGDQRLSLLVAQTVREIEAGDSICILQPSDQPKHQSVNDTDMVIQSGL